AVLLHGVFGEPRGAEGGELGMLQIELAGPAEKLLVLGIRSRPAAFDVVDAQLIQLLGNDELVIHRERDGFALRAIAESGIECRDLHKAPIFSRLAPSNPPARRLLSSCA